MRLAHYELAEPIEFEENFVNTLVVENPVLLRRFVSELYEQIHGNSGGFVLSENNKIMELSKDAELIIDFFNLQNNSRQILAKVMQAVNSEYSLLLQESERIKADINELAYNIASKLDFEVDFNELCDLSGVLKQLGFHLSFSEKCFNERLIEYIFFLNSYLDKKLFILVNLKSFIPYEDLEEFIKIMNYKKINILFIEGFEAEKKLTTEKIRIIDKDLCEI